MDYGKNIKYFKSSDTLFYIGLPICILGAILFVLTLLWFYFIPYQAIIGIILAVIGGALAFIPRSMRTSEKELDAIITSMTEGYTKEVIERMGLEKHILKTIPTTAIGNYIYDAPDIMVRRGKDDRKCRTSKYSTTAVLCTKNGILLSQKIFSLIDETVTEATHEFLYSELELVAVTEHEYTLADGSKLKDSRFTVTENGKELLALPTLHIIAVDRLADDINRMIVAAKQ